MRDLIAILGLTLLIAVYALFPAYVVMDIADLAHIPFLEDLKFYQGYGFYIIVRICTIHRSNTEQDQALEETFDKILNNLLKGGIALLITWGLVHLVFFLFFHT